MYINNYRHPYYFYRIFDINNDKYVLFKEKHVKIFHFILVNSYSNVNSQRYFLWRLCYMSIPSIKIIFIQIDSYPEKIKNWERNFDCAYIGSGLENFLVVSCLDGCLMIRDGLWWTIKTYYELWSPFCLSTCCWVLT